MKLDRNLNSDGKGKYAIINLRKLEGAIDTPAALAFAIMANPECIEFGNVGAPDEFWLIKLRDTYAQASLRAYADAARIDDPEFAAEVDELASRAGVRSPHHKRPD